MPISVGSRVSKLLYDAQTILVAVLDNIPTALTVPASSFFGRKASGDLTTLTATEAAAILASTSLGRKMIVFHIPGNGAAPTTGVKPSSAVRVPWACTVVAWHIYSDASGLIVVDVMKDTHANFPPTDADRIAGTDKPTLSSAQKNTSTALTDWTTALAEDDVLVVEVESASTLTHAIVMLEVSL